MTSLSALAEAVGTFCMGLLIVDAILLVVLAAAHLRLAYWKRRLRRAEEHLVVIEARMVLEVADQVRATCPPMPSLFLAEIVSAGCERAKDMGLPS